MSHDETKQKEKQCSELPKTTSCDPLNNIQRLTDEVENKSTFKKRDTSLFIKYINKRD